jgi:hypothetical protein
VWIALLAFWIAFLIAAIIILNRLLIAAGGLGIVHAGLMLRLGRRRSAWPSPSTQRRWTAGRESRSADR